MKTYLTYILLSTFFLSSYASFSQFNPGPGVYNSPGIGGFGTPGVRIVVQQDVKLSSGDIKGLIRIRKVNIKYDYEYMIMCDSNDAKKFLQPVRKTKLEPAFKNYFNKNTENIDLIATNDSIAPNATLIVKVIREDPHYHRKDGAVPPSLSLECTFLDEDGYFIIRFTLSSMGSRGKDLAGKIEECYAIAGKMLGREISKRILKSENPHD